jgi:mono/diheme cytochrome c family protein
VEERRALAHSRDPMPGPAARAGRSAGIRSVVHGVQAQAVDRSQAQAVDRRAQLVAHALERERRLRVRTPIHIV